ncbi:MAG: 30S ribosomal protein S4 [Candidatus Woesearchaeota archaeon]
MIFTVPFIFQLPYDAITFSSRIEQEKLLVKEYGLRNKTEIWKLASKLKNFADQAKKLVAHRREAQAGKEKVQLLSRLNRLGLLNKEAVLEDVLGLTIKDMLELRLQTQVCRKGLAKTMKQARQFITHGHILVNGKKVTSPSYLIKSDEAPTISFATTSALSNAEHPERRTEKTKVVESSVEKTNKEKSEASHKAKKPTKGKEKTAIKQEQIGKTEKTPAKQEE